MVALQNRVSGTREHWWEYQPRWYRALIKSRRLKKALQDAAERMYRELTEQEAASICESAPMTVDRWRRMKLEKKMRHADAEVRRALQLEHDKPMVNLFAYAPLAETVGLSAGDVRILKMVWSDPGDGDLRNPGLSRIEALSRLPRHPVARRTGHKRGAAGTAPDINAPGD
jgi:hypothetical protein